MMHEHEVFMNTVGSRVMAPHSGIILTRKLFFLPLHDVREDIDALVMQLFTRYIRRQLLRGCGAHPGVDATTTILCDPEFYQRL